MAGGLADGGADGLAGRGCSADLRTALQAVPAGEVLTAYRQLAQEVSRPGSAAPPMYPVLGAAGIPMAWPQALADGRLPGLLLLTGTTRDEMATIAPFADVDTEATFRAGTLAIAGDYAAAGHPAYVYQFDYTPFLIPRTLVDRTAPSSRSSSTPSMPTPAAPCSARPRQRYVPSPTRSRAR